MKNKVFGFIKNSKAKKVIDDTVNNLNENVVNKTPNSIKRIINNEDKTVKELKNEMKKLSNEKLKLVEILGTEVYDLFINNKEINDELLPFLEKIKEIDTLITDLENKKNKIEKNNSNKNVCDCGNKLNENDIFCSSCGIIVDPDYIRCSCGSLENIENKFCSECGSEIAEKSEEKNDLKECICGEKIKSDSVICLNCGRKI